MLGQNKPWQSPPKPSKHSPMSMHEQAPEHFVNTFNAAWDIGLKSAIWLGVFLLCYFFFGLAGWGAFIGAIIAVGVIYGAYSLFHALFIGPADPDEEPSGH